ncbi:MAG: hypothetical protein PHF84_00205 [bacterium]|nr:hypothetical protein [bacterium]
MLFLSASLDAAGSFDNYVGLNLIYNQAELIEPESDSQGLGADLFYQSYVRPNFSYSILFGFLYNFFSNDFQEQIFYPTSGTMNLDYTREDRFYHFSMGLLFNYSRLYGAFRPFISLGTLGTFIYKTYHYTYRTSPGDFIETEKKSWWLPTTLFIPISLGVQYFLDQKNLIQFCFSYHIPLWDKTVENYGYTNILCLKLGYLRSISFKL